jgi:cytochrome c553
MPPILSNYSTDDKQALAAYLAQLPAPGKSVMPEAPR